MARASVGDLRRRARNFLLDSAAELDVCGNSPGTGAKAPIKACQLELNGLVTGLICEASTVIQQARLVVEEGTDRQPPWLSIARGSAFSTRDSDLSASCGAVLRPK